MRKILIGLLTILLVSIPLFSKATIKFKATTVDFGEVDDNQTAEALFEFENVGDSLLTIKRVLPSCGCTVVKLQKKEYQPGEKGVIPVKFNSRGYRERVTKTIQVHTNDEANANVRLVVTGKVVLKNFSEPQVEPGALDFEKVRVGKKYKKEIKIENIGTIDLSIIDLFHGPEIIPELGKALLKPKEKTKLLVTFKPMAPGKFSKWLRVRTNSLKKRYITIKVTAEIE